MRSNYYLKDKILISLYIHTKYPPFIHIWVYKTKSLIKQNVWACDHSIVSEISQSYYIKRKEDTLVHCQEEHSACFAENRTA